MPVSLTRRLLVLATLAGIGVGALPRRVAAATIQGHAGRGGALPCVLDSRMDQFPQWRAAAEGAGMAVTEFERDIGSLAMQIDTGWQAHQSALSGITLPSSFFIVEQIARRRGLVPVLVGAHCRDHAGDWRHELHVHSSSMLAAAGASVEHWRWQVCNVVHEVSRGWSPARLGSPAQLSTPYDDGVRGPMRYISWSIQPKA